MTTNRKIEVKKKSEMPPKRENPLYNAFCYQMSAALELARKIESDKDFPAPSYVRRFLDEFGGKTA
jgi:hypothetical protein